MYVSECEFCELTNFTFIFTVLALNDLIIWRFVHYLYRIFNIFCSTIIVKELE